MHALAEVHAAQPLGWQIVTVIVLGICVLVIAAAAVAFTHAVLKGDQDADDIDGDDARHVPDPIPPVPAARTYVEPALRTPSPVTRLRGLPGHDAGVGSAPRAAKGFQRSRRS